MTDASITVDDQDIDQNSGWSLGSSVVLAGLTLTSFFNYTDRMAVSVLIEPIKKSLSISDTQVGLITGLAFAFFYAVMGVPIGRLADTRNKSTILVACFVLWSVMTGLSGLATSFASLFFLRLMVGVGEAGCLPTSFAIISERFSAGRRPLAISIFQAGGRLGVALGMAGAGIAGQVLGWRVALMVIGACGLPAALLVRLSLGNGRLSKARQAAATAPKARLAHIIGVPGFLSLIAAISLASFATYGITQWFPAFFVRSYGASLASSGLWNGLAGGLGGFTGTLAGGFAAGILIRRHLNWDLWLPAISYALAAPLFIASITSPTIAGASMFFLVANLVATSGSGVALAAVQRFTLPAHRATANALMLMISALTGVGLGPVAVGFLSDRLKPQFGAGSLRYALAASALAFLVSSLCFLLSAKRARGSALHFPPSPVIADRN